MGAAPLAKGGSHPSSQEARQFLAWSVALCLEGRGVSLTEGLYGKRRNETVLRGSASERCVRLASGLLSSVAGEGVPSLTASTESWGG